MLSKTEMVDPKDSVLLNSEMKLIKKLLWMPVPNSQLKDEN